MKKISLLIFGLLVMTTLASAQTAFGIKGGWQRTGVGTDFGDSKKSSKANFGLVANYGHQRILSFQSELNYSRKGGEFKDVDYSDGGVSESLKSVEQSYDYLELPLLLKLGIGKNFRVFAVAGPFVAVPLRVKTVSGGNTDNGNSDIDGTKVFGKVDLGYQVGAGLTLKLGPGHLLAEFRYSQGFGEEIFKNSNNTSTLQTNIGYAFYVGGR